MKKITKPNPLKTFNDNKAMAYKKAGGEMKAFKKSLTKAQKGISVNSGMDSISKARQSMQPDSQSNVNEVNKSIIDKANTMPKYPSVKEMDKKSTEEQIKSKYGTAKSKGLTNPDFEKLNGAKKGGAVKRKMR